MWKYIVKRLLWMIPVLLGISIVIFTIMYFCPGDPASAILGNGATPAAIAEKRAEMGLDEPYLVRLGNYLSQVFSTLTWVPLTSRISRSCRYSLQAALHLCHRSHLHAAADSHRHSSGDYRGRTSEWYRGPDLYDRSPGRRIDPGFWLAMMLVLVFSVQLGWLPPYGVGGIEYLILPCIANAFAGIASQARQTRSSMLEVIRSDYIVTARAKGLSEREILYKHALPNALIPIITVVGNGMGMMLGGTVVIESVFSIPGIGMYTTQAINNGITPLLWRRAVFGSCIQPDHAAGGCDLRLRRSQNQGPV